MPLEKPVDTPGTILFKRSLDKCLVERNTMKRFDSRDKAGNVIFRQFLHEGRSCASYLIGCPSKGVAAVVDPQTEPSGYESIAEQHGLRITDIIDTHVHADHPSGARDLAERVGARLALGAGTDVAFEYEALADGEVVEVGNRRIRVIHTPGH